MLNGDTDDPVPVPSAHGGVFDPLARIKCQPVLGCERFPRPAPGAFLKDSEKKGRNQDECNDADHYVDNRHDLSLAKTSKTDHTVRPAATQVMLSAKIGGVPVSKNLKHLSHQAAAIRARQGGSK
jgi:hypothetical protein